MNQNNGFDAYVGQAQGLQNYQHVLSPHESIKRRISIIDHELSQFSEERRQQLLAERARLLKAQEALG
jgi:hypothetical protein